jgi:hypothetical protein
MKKFLEGATNVIVNLLLSLFWSYNYISIIIEERLKPYGFKLKSVAIKTEPPLEKWNCSAYVQSNKLVEQYEYGVENEFLVFSDPVGDVLYLKKCDGYMLSKIEPCVPEFAAENKTRFLNILYIHPKMNESVKLTLDPSYIRSGNTVFSRTFVCRLLNYSGNSSYYFDDDYELHIMDNKIKKHVIKSNECLVFDDNDSFTIR